MNSYLPQDAPDELLKAIRSGQQAFIEAIKTFADEMLQAAGPLLAGASAGQEATTVAGA
jgi:hypothetical protein